MTSRTASPWLNDFRKRLSRGGRVVVIGSSNTDLVITSPSLPSPGQTVLGGALQIHAGGKGANQAVAAARAGAKVFFIGSISPDTYGDQAVARLSEEGIHVDAVERPSGSNSGVALILVDEQGQNLISVAKSSNDLLSAAQVRRSLKSLAIPAAMVLQLEIPIPAIQAGLDFATSHKIPVILNPAPARKLPRRAIQAVHTLIPNESELSFLIGRKANSASAIERGARELVKTGVHQVIVTCGSRGVCWVRRDLVLWLPAMKVKAIDTTGAGDCFTGGFAAAFAAGLPTRESIEFALRGAGLSVTQKGAQPSMPALKSILAMEDAAVHG